MMSDDILQPISKDDIPKLLELLRGDMPHSTVVYHFLETQSRWSSQVPGMQLQVLCPRGDWRSGTVVALTSGLAIGKVFGAVYTLEESGETLKEALIKTKLIPENFSHFTGVIARHITSVIAALNERGLKVRDLAPCHLHHMSAEDASQIDVPQCPEGVHVGSLDASHLDVVCSNWPHYSPEYRPVMFNIIDKNPSTGVFVDGELAAMVLQSEYGGLGMLQTVPAFRRRGLASVALAHQARKMGRAGVSPHFHVIVDNLNAMQLFKKTKFKIVDQSHWVLIEK